LAVSLGIAGWAAYSAAEAKAQQVVVARPVVSQYLIGGYGGTTYQTQYYSGGYNYPQQYYSGYRSGYGNSYYGYPSGYSPYGYSRSYSYPNSYYSYPSYNYGYPSYGYRGAYRTGYRGGFFR